MNEIQGRIQRTLWYTSCAKQAQQPERALNFGGHVSICPSPDHTRQTKGGNSVQLGLHQH